MTCGRLVFFIIVLLHTVVFPVHGEVGIYINNLTEEEQKVYEISYGLWVEFLSCINIMTGIHDGATMLSEILLSCGTSNVG